MNRLVIASMVLALAVWFTPAVRADGDKPEPYREVIDATAGMVSDADAVRLAQRHGLQVLNVTWEDTGRYKGSSVGPNISDMTIQVQEQDPRTKQYRLTCMPVIRFPNFSDRTADIKPDQFFLLVGNEKRDGRGGLRKVSLREYLGKFREYITDSSSWKGDKTSLLAPRDSHVLVSAQACFLPIPRKGAATFNAVLFNYQSTAGDPAVLTILATREGTSATIIDNTRDAFEAGSTWGQRLFFNQKGERASLTGQRLTDFAATQQRPSSGHATAHAAGEEGLNMVLLIQVPLKQKTPMHTKGLAAPCCDSASPSGGAYRSRGSDVENAVVGHGKVEGPFTEIAGLPIERDPKFPIRVTVQFYKATSNGVVNDDDLASIASQIERVYAKADYVGSLVTGGDTRRPTEYDGDKHEPADWWQTFWKRYEANTGQSRQDAIKMLRNLLGPSWQSLPRDQVLETLKRKP